jgi:hypothetical protein
MSQKITTNQIKQNTARILGRTTAGVGITEQLTASQVTALLDSFTNALKGLVPASGGGTTNFLRADGTWSPIPNTGVWGSISGTLSNQTDLQNALNAKANLTGANFSGSISVSGDVNTSGPSNQISIGPRNNTGGAVLYNQGGDELRVYFGTDRAIFSNTGLAVIGEVNATAFKNTGNAIVEGTTGVQFRVNGSQVGSFGSGGLEAAFIRARGTSVPLDIDSTNSNSAKISLTDNGTIRSYWGADSTNLLRVFNTSSQERLALSTAGNLSVLGTIAASNFSGSSSGTNTGDQTTITGNAGTATTLQTARTINGVSFNGSANITVTANTPNSLTYNNAGTGAASGTTFNGSAATTISYNTIGAPSTTGTNASGTWGISITGSSASATGNAGTATTLATGRTIGMTGDVSWTSPAFNGSANVTAAGTIQAGMVTNAKLADMATQTFKGRTTAGTGVPEDLTVTQATALLNTFTTSLKGLAPASGGGTTNFLRADGTWAAPATGVAWGSITGTLSNQTDLNTALNAKANLASPTFTGTVSGATAAFSLYNIAAGGAATWSNNTITTYVNGVWLNTATSTTGYLGVGGSSVLTWSASGVGITGSLSASNFSGSSSGTNTGDQTNITGNAGTATTLQTARTINGVSFNGSANITVTANTPNSLTYNNGGSGAASGTTFNGSAATTISYNTIGAPSTTGTNASGTWGINITGNAATATTASSANAVTWANVSGKPFSYSGQAGQPSWLWGTNNGSEYFVWNPSNFSVNYATSAGSASSATTATSATNASNVPWSGVSSKPAWNSVHTDGIQIAYNMAWRNPGTGHVIFDASASLSPSGTSVNNTNPQVAWTATYGTLMGWNGANTYGVRVDRARTADNVLNTDNPLGPSRLYRRDQSDSYNVQTHWTGSHWHLRGYETNTFHGECRVGYADTAGSATTASSATTATTATTATNSTQLGGVDSSNWVRRDVASAVNGFSCAGMGTNSGISAEHYKWGYQEAGSWAGGNSSLILGYHVGVKIGANNAYGGTRIYNDHPAYGTVLMAFGGADVTVTNNFTAGGNVTAYSDARLKTNVRTVENALEKVCQMRGVHYDRIDRDGEAGTGVIAQEIQEVAPELVQKSEKTVDDDSETLTVSYGNTAGYFIEAIKELKGIVDEQREMIETMKAEIAALKKG